MDEKEFVGIVERINDRATLIILFPTELQGIQLDNPYMNHMGGPPQRLPLDEHLHKLVAFSAEDLSRDAHNQYTTYRASIIEATEIGAPTLNIIRRG